MVTTLAIVSVANTEYLLTGGGDNVINVFNITDGNLTKEKAFSC
jgi:hypothetical protein